LACYQIIIYIAKQIYDIFLKQKKSILLTEFPAIGALPKSDYTQAI